MQCVPRACPATSFLGVVRVNKEGVAGLQRLGSQDTGAAAAAAKREAKRAGGGVAVLDLGTLAGGLPA